MCLKKACVPLIAILVCTAAQAQVKTFEQIASDSKSQVVQMPVEELEKKMDAEEKIILIDVRTEKEYLAAHIEGANWISRGKAEFGTQGISTDPKVEIIVYCRTGTRSSLSALALRSIGYENVVSLDGGFKQWVEEGNSAFNMHGEIKVVSFEKKENK
jgi:rhodanese-related sulfurtransferase